MTPADELRRRLIAWRERVRLLRAIAGAQAGAAVGLGAAVMLSLGRVAVPSMGQALTTAPWPLLAGIVVTGLVVGAGVGALRRGPKLAACARAIDATRGRSGDGAVVSAWDFVARADRQVGLVDLAVRTGGGEAAKVALPSLTGGRQPIVALGALGVGAIALAIAPAASSVGASRTHDVGRGGAAVAAITRALKDRAAESPHAQVRSALAAAAATLEPPTEKASGPLVRSSDPRATAGPASADAESRAAPAPVSEAAAIATALEQAAQQLATATATAGADSPPQRQLERLRRDLDDAADACRRDPAACARSLERLERALGEPERPQTAPSPRRDPTANRTGQPRNEFERAAAGAPRPSGSGPQEERARESAGNARPEGERPGQSEGAGTAASVAAAQIASAASVGAEGSPGSADDGAPLGRRSAQVGGGFAAALPEGSDDEAGPSRSEVIATSAGGGFATPAYRRAFADYAHVAEELVESNTIPAHRRELVRRYFDLIRPRGPAR